MNDAKLVNLTDSDFTLPGASSLSRSVQTVDASSLPLLAWPNGSWCHPGNRYLQTLFERNLSRRNRGGSLSVAAYQLSHLIRFCWDGRIEPHELTDDEFSTFMHQLRSSSRSGTTLRQIGSHSLALILCECEHRQIKPSVQLLTRMSRSRSRWRTTSSVSHRSFPPPSPRRRRFPISDVSLSTLYDAANGSDTNSHVRMRRIVMLRLLECSGARRSEISEIRVSDVRQANLDRSGLLRMVTLKRRTESPVERYVPISPANLELLTVYIDFYRRDALRRSKATKDHGFLLVNDRRGTPLTPGGITLEVRKISTFAGMDRPASPHLFRHRFITKLFVSMIESHHLENADDLRRMILDGESIKRRICEWTGHSDPSSLEQYIHLAWDEVSARQSKHEPSSGPAQEDLIREIRMVLKDETLSHSDTTSRIRAILSLTNSEESFGVPQL